MGAILNGKRVTVFSSMPKTITNFIRMGMNYPHSAHDVAWCWLLYLHPPCCQRHVPHPCLCLCLHPPLVLKYILKRN